MTLAPEPPKPQFRLSMLIYDTRYRAVTIQVIVLILVLLFRPRGLFGERIQRFE